MLRSIYKRVYKILHRSNVIRRFYRRFHSVRVAENFIISLLKYDFKLYHINEQEKRIEPPNVSALLLDTTLYVYGKEYEEHENTINLLCIKEA